MSNKTATKKLRSIKAKFWINSFIIELNPIEKLVFLYVLTCPLKNLTGVYENIVANISFNTGIEKDKVKKILNRFEIDDKMIYSKEEIINN